MMREEYNKALEENARLKQVLEEARLKLEEQDEFITSLTSPPRMCGTVLRMNQGTVDVALHSKARYEVNFDPKLKASLEPGAAVHLNPQSMAVIGMASPYDTGNVGIIDELYPDGRIMLSVHGETVMAGSAVKENKVGDAARLDPTSSIVIENLGNSGRNFMLEETPEVTWDMIGGLNGTIDEIRELIEKPFTDKGLYEKYMLGVSKGILLYGPPGCGKTMIGKAIAYSLAQKSGNRSSEYFMNIKGPEVLNEYVGVSERTIRRIFSRAKDRAKENGSPVIIYIDEAESLLQKRGTGISSDVNNTIVPQFLSEMDGIDETRDVVVVLSSNRSDIIDPAVLRPERVDRKIRVGRPDCKGAEDIFGIYLKGRPLDKESDCNQLAVHAVAELYKEENALFTIRYAGGNSDPVRYGDLASGAAIKSVVNRAALYALKREREKGGRKQNVAGGDRQNGITGSDISRAIRDEYGENAHFMQMLCEDDIREIAGNRVREIVSIEPYMG